MADVDLTARHTGTALDERAAAAITEVLEGERGSVAALVQLAAMATDALERHALVVMGGQAAQACIDLRALLARHSAPVSDRVGDAAGSSLHLERLDERYQAFGALQQRLMAVIESIPRAQLDALDQGTLAMVHTIESAQAAWAAQHAHDFAASREAALLAAGRPDDATGGTLAEAEPRPDAPATLATPASPATPVAELPAPAANTSAPPDAPSPPPDAPDAPGPDTERAGA